MDHKIRTIKSRDIPFPLKQIPEPPKLLYIKGSLPKPDAKILCIVGARKHSSYGEEVTKNLISGLCGYNICIVSGLALGIDEIAHRKAIEIGLQTVAFPGSGLLEDVLYPKKNISLSREIVENGGGLISEFENNFPAFEWTFPRRNRLMAGISDAVIIIEAKINSGSQITARLALDYNRSVGAVPGQITSPLSEIPNNLIRDGAIPITSSEDILEMLGFSRPEGKIIQKELLINLNPLEKRIIELLQIEPHTSNELILKSGINIKEINENISSLEIQGLIKEVSGKFKLC